MLAFWAPSGYSFPSRVAKNTHIHAHVFTRVRARVCQNCTKPIHTFYACIATIDDHVCFMQTRLGGGRRATSLFG